MRFTKLLALLFMAAAIPMRATDDEASAAPSSTEPNLGESSAVASASPTADTATTSSSTTSEQASDTASAGSAGGSVMNPTKPASHAADASHPKTLTEWYPADVKPVREGIAAELVNEFHKLEEKVEHFLHPDAPAVAQPGEQPASTSQPAADTTAKSSELQGTGDSPNAAPAADAQPATQPSVQGVSTDASTAAAEHPHTSCLRKIVACLRRDFAMLPGELESWVKTAESHL